MARKKRPRKLRPRKPARVRKKRAPAKGRVAGHHRPELGGLALAALGIFLGACLYGSWNGGTAGAWLARNAHHLLGAAVYVLPIVLVCVGGLMLARSSLVDFRPFRLGLLAMRRALVGAGGFGDTLESLLCSRECSAGVQQCPFKPRKRRFDLRKLHVFDKATEAALV